MNNDHVIETLKARVKYHGDRLFENKNRPGEVHNYHQNKKDEFEHAISILKGKISDEFLEKWVDEIAYNYNLHNAIKALIAAWVKGE